jgi:hypothetical protein
VSVGFRQGTNDRCFYYSHDRFGNLNAVAAIVVDEVLAAASDEVWASEVKSLGDLSIVLDDESVGHAREFNGMEIKRVSKHHYELGQESYVTEMSQKYMDKYQPKIKKNRVALMWLSSSTRPDLAFVTSAAGTFSAKPGNRQLDALEHALHHAVATRDRGLVFNFTECRGRMDMTVFTDSDYAGDRRTSRSRSG